MIKQFKYTEQLRSVQPNYSLSHLYTETSECSMKSNISDNSMKDLFFKCSNAYYTSGHKMSLILNPIWNKE